MRVVNRYRSPKQEKRPFEPFFSCTKGLHCFCLCYFLLLHTLWLGNGADAAGADAVFLAANGLGLQIDENSARCLAHGVASVVRASWPAGAEVTES